MDVIINNMLGIYSVWDIIECQEDIINGEVIKNNVYILNLFVVMFWYKMRYK